MLLMRRAGHALVHMLVGTGLPSLTVSCLVQRVVHCMSTGSLKKAIPEMEFYAMHHDFSGRPFRSRRFTKLRYCAHTVSNERPLFAVRV
jgi:hypothetical protein